MVGCVKELMLEGKNVKIDDLAIFSIGIKNVKGGAATEEDFSVASNIGAWLIPLNTELLSRLL